MLNFVMISMIRTDANLVNKGYELAGLVSRNLEKNRMTEDAYFEYLDQLVKFDHPERGTVVATLTQNPMERPVLALRMIRWMEKSELIDGDASMPMLQWSLLEVKSESERVTIAWSLSVLIRKGNAAAI
jgi:hypothetical protein